VLSDARCIADGTELDFDLVVVGAGPAGITLVDRLRTSGLRVCLLEGGAEDPDVDAQRLYRGENVGHPYYPLHTCRFRLFGGGSNRWGGWCRPLERQDFEAHDWIPGSGWPIGHADVQPYYEDAAQILGLPSSRFDPAAWADRMPAPLPLPGRDFQNALFLYSPELNFADSYSARIAAADTITTLLRANVTELRLDDAGERIAAARVQTLGGGAFTVRARAFVLAAGGIENARLLLASRGQRPAGLGNEHDLVGRHFMDHLHVAAGHLLLNGSDVRPDFYRKASYPGLKARGVLTPTAEALVRHRLLGCSIAVEPASYAYGTPFLGWPPEVTFGAVRAYRGLRRGRGRRAVEWLKGSSERAWNAVRQLETARAARVARARAGTGKARVHSLYFRSEQVPSPDSRVTLGERRDALGVPEARLDWRVGRADTESITGWLAHLDAELRSTGLGQVVMPVDGWETGVIGGPHHMGTTRMSSDPRHGVVDADGRVHSVANLYVAGSSVFTTGGYANPTFTIVALALRLAEELRERLGAPGPAR
jgi:choline dehydrogenase-like flavoprotein